MDEEFVELNNLLNQDPNTALTIRLIDDVVFRLIRIIRLLGHEYVIFKDQLDDIKLILSGSRTKKCGMCKKILPIIRFSTSGYDKKGNRAYRPMCLICSAIHRKTYNSTSYAYQKKIKEANPERFKGYQEKDKAKQKIRCANWYAENKRYINNQHADYRKANPEKEKVRHAKWYQENKAWIVKRNKKYLDSNPGIKLSRSCRTRVSNIFKSGKDASDLLGCDTEFLYEWFMFSLSFCDDDLTFENYGTKWHIDHVIPCAVYDLTDEKQKKICFHWTNLAPLEKIENMSKGGRVYQSYIDIQNDRLRMFGIMKEETYEPISYSGETH